MVKRKIAYITGTRADFGLMSLVLREINKSKKLELRILVTGMHLMKEFGSTITEIRKEFKKVTRISATYEKDNRKSMALFTATFSKKLITHFSKDRPDILVVLGDRAEMISASIIALYLGIPVAHIHGGDVTKTIDEVARHAITKLSSLHFVATSSAGNRVKKLGEDLWRIHVVGAPGLDFIKSNKLLSRKKLLEELKIDTKRRIILILQHPIIEEDGQAAKQIRETIEAARVFKETVILIYPNSDAGARKMIKEIKKYEGRDEFYTFKSLPYKTFLSLQKEAAVFVGNSSAGMVESSSLGVPVVNIGQRELGRERGNNVLDVGHNRAEIIKAIDKSLNNKEYIAKVKKTKNPWGDGKASKRIIKTLENISIDDRLLSKQLTYG